MDDTSLRTLEERLHYLRGLAERKEAVKSAIEEQGKLTAELSAAIDTAATLAEVEDLYRPYKQKRRTRATIAREKGLAPLAEALMAPGAPDPMAEAAKYVDAEKGVETAEDALAGASDIVAETVSDDAALRGKLRELLMKNGVLHSQAATEEDSVYRLYYDFTQPLSKLQGHQILAINRGEKEEKLKVSVELDRELALRTVRRSVVIPGSAAMDFLKAAAEDAYDRLIFPSLEREADVYKRQVGGVPGRQGRFVAVFGHDKGPPFFDSKVRRHPNGCLQRVRSVSPEAKRLCWEERGESGGDHNAAAVRACSPSNDYRMMMESRSGPTET